MNHPPVEYRHAALGDVNHSERIIEMVAVPYEEEATVEYRGELWDESFLRGAFDGVETRTDPIRANRDHDTTRLVGQAIAFHPSRDEGLVAEVRIAKTVLGDETLALAEERMVDLSVGFGVRGSDQVLNRPKRLIKRAFLDHISFVAAPAYAGAKVLAVRARDDVDAAELPRLETPNLNEVMAWLQARSS
jgi:HK97 family phage prohead protease